MQSDSESRLKVFMELIFSVVIASPGWEERLNYTYKWQMNQSVAPAFSSLLPSCRIGTTKRISGKQYPTLIELMRTN